MFYRNFRRGVFVLGTEMRMKKKLSVLFAILTYSFVFANTYKGDVQGTTITRIPVWVFLETMPGATSEYAKASLPPRKAITELSCYLLSGLVFGSDFSYTPYDKTRNVPEFFEVTEKYRISPDDQALEIKELVPSYPYLYCLAEYTASDVLAKRQESWKTLSYKTVKGYGVGERSDEIQGVYDAYHNAIKDAVRRYAQTLTKNKPAEVSGQFMIKGEPRLYMKSGRFHASLELYIIIDTIRPYTQF